MLGLLSPAACLCWHRAPEGPGGPGRRPRRARLLYRQRIAGDAAAPERGLYSKRLPGFAQRMQNANYTSPTTSPSTSPSGMQNANYTSPATSPSTSPSGMQNAAYTGSPATSPGGSPTSA